MTEHRDMTLGEIGNGALEERFQVELQRVLNNIADPNTDVKAKRVITVQVTFRPGKNRDDAAIDVRCSSKLAGITSVESMVFIGRRDGKVVAVENDIKQSGLFDEQQPEPRPLAAVANFQQQGSR